MTSMPSLEINFDGLVGSTHHYAGLSRGNVASESNEGELSRPREAALQGLRKMRALWDRGVPQGVFPPQERPHLGALRALGFEGSDAEILAKVARSSPGLLQAMSSASAMWAANAATVAPSADTRDGRVHFTPANLQAKLHRSIESEGTSRMLRRIFRDEAHFAHHAPLPGGANLGDEGAANHTRLHPGGAQGWGGPGLQLFVYGRRYFARPDEPRARRYPARQAREASEAIARLHGLDPAAFILAQQNPEAIDAGVFHNDVIAVGHEDHLLYHEAAFVEETALLGSLEAGLGAKLSAIRVTEAALPMAEAVRSYLFNSQIVTLPSGSLLLVAPEECRQSDRSRAVIETLLAQGSNRIDEVLYLEVRESMRNGGGPACLRLRVALTEAERSAVHAPCLFDASLQQRLEAWVRAHYRETLRPAELADPCLLEEGRRALDELTQILELGSDFYPFQRS